MHRAFQSHGGERNGARGAMRAAPLIFIALITPILSACQHGDDAWMAVLENPSMETSSPRFLRPQTNLAYVPEEQVRRGLQAKDIVIDERLRDDLLDYASTFFDEAPGARLPDNSLRPITDWPNGPEIWGEITHIGLSSEGDIRMINVIESGFIVERGETAPRRFEIYVIPTSHSRYELALPRVMMLLPGLRPGAGMVRLTTPMDSPWPFFDYDVVAAPYFSSLSELGRDRAYETVVARDDDLTLCTHVSAVSWDAENAVSLFCPLNGRVVQIQPNHAAHSRVLAELRRTIPGLQRGQGYTAVLFTAPPPWPFRPLEQAVDDNVRRRSQDPTEYWRAWDPPPPQIP